MFVLAIEKDSGRPGLIMDFSKSSISFEKNGLVINMGLQKKIERKGLPYLGRVVFTFFIFIDRGTSFTEERPMNKAYTIWQV